MTGIKYPAQIKLNYYMQASRYIGTSMKTFKWPSVFLSKLN